MVLRSAMVLVGLCLAALAHAQQMRDESITSLGVTYRVVGVNSFFMVTSTGDRSAPRTHEESLMRCDSLVAKVFAMATAGRRPAVYERARIGDPSPRGEWIVDYEQRHQGYPVRGGGARVNLGPDGRIELMGLQYESESFPIFHPKARKTLRWIARAAVFPRRVNAMVEESLMVEPTSHSRFEGHPARMTYIAVYRTRGWFDGRESGWQVIVDAVTGKIIDSRDTSMHAIAANGDEAAGRRVTSPSSP